METDKIYSLIENPAMKIFTFLLVGFCAWEAASHCNCFAILIVCQVASSCSCLFYTNCQNLLLRSALPCLAQMKTRKLKLNLRIQLTCCSLLISTHSEYECVQIGCIFKLTKIPRNILLERVQTWEIGLWSLINWKIDWYLGCDLYWVTSRHVNVKPG